jgi:predicted dinucleotide-binding enzyme
MVMELLGEISGLRALDGGSLANAAAVEAFAAVILTVNLRHKGHGTLRLNGVEA